MHVRSPTVPTAPDLDHFYRENNRLFAFCVHTRPQDRLSDRGS
jgi:hypothetical protein